MKRVLLKKSVGESQWLWLACAAVLYAFCWLRVWLVSQFDMGRFEAVLEQFREWERFSPVPFEQLLTYSGRIAMTYDEPIVLLAVSVWAIARGSDAVSGELGRGTMEMLLAQPVSRLQVLSAQASVTVGGTALLALAAWAGTSTGIATTTVTEEITPTWTIPWLGYKIPDPLGEKEIRVTPMSEKTNAKYFLPAAFNLFSLGFFLAGLSTLMSSWDRYRWRTIGIMVGVWVVQMIFKIIAIAAERFAWLSHLTFFTAYEPVVFVSVAVDSPEGAWKVLRYDEQGQWLEFGPLGYNLVLLVLGSAAYFAAAVIFSRRDLPAPL